MGKKLIHECRFLKDKISTKSERNSQTKPFFLENPLSQLTWESFLSLFPLALTRLHNAPQLSSEPFGQN
jgi:hypothetical protein